MPTYAAVDLGATSGRVVNVEITGERLTLDLVHRFPTTSIERGDGSLVWDMEDIHRNILTGLRAAAARSTLRSLGVDSWAIDYGLFDAAGARVGPVHAYRSHRTDGVMDAVTERLGRQRIYATTGIQFLPFNTIYQLAAAGSRGELADAAQLLMVPDVVNHRLCGSTTNEITNASTTQLLDARTHEWSDDLCAAIGVPRSLLPALHAPGTTLGAVTGQGDAALDGLAVVAVASHDTASAIAGTPLRSTRPAIYISCGTWALVGCELAGPVTTESALAANLTNELGVGNTTRLLKNVTGLWLLEECRRAWATTGFGDIAALLAEADRVPPGRTVIDPDDDRLTGGHLGMPDLIREVCAATAQPVPQSPAEITRVIIDSLALAFRRVTRTIERITGIDAEVIHLIGGGARNSMLARLTASACGRPVHCGPAEATVIGNALVQAIADGVIGDLDHGRRLVDAAAPAVVEPSSTLDWDELEERLDRVGGSRNRSPIRDACADESGPSEPSYG